MACCRAARPLYSLVSPTLFPGPIESLWKGRHYVIFEQRGARDRLSLARPGNNGPPLQGTGHRPRHPRTVHRPNWAWGAAGPSRTLPLRVSGRPCKYFEFWAAAPPRPGPAPGPASAPRATPAPGARLRVDGPLGSRRPDLARRCTWPGPGRLS